MAHLTKVIPLSDRVYIYDNSLDGVSARLCARTRKGALRKVYGPLPEWVADAVATAPRDAEFVDLRRTG